MLWQQFSGHVTDCPIWALTGTVSLRQFTYIWLAILPVMATSFPDPPTGTVLPGCWGVFGFPLNSRLWLQTKWLHFSLIRPQNLFPKALRFSKLAFLRRGQICEEPLILLRPAWFPTSASELCISFSIIAGLLDTSLTIAFLTRALSLV